MVNRIMLMRIEDGHVGSVEFLSMWAIDFYRAYYYPTVTVSSNHRKKRQETVFKLK